MPFGSEGVEDGIALALSGGGFRATLFHVGTLWRLNELRVLPKLDRISSISGGSITAGLLGLRWSQLNFDQEIATNFGDLIVDPLREFCTRRVDSTSITIGAILPGSSISDRVQKSYEKHLFGTKTLQDLPDHPRFVINSTNLKTGRSFRFSKPYAGDYLVGLIRNPGHRVSLAVTASSAFPPVLSPVKFKVPPGSFEKVDGAELNDNPAYTREQILTDGGAYDNLGLETVWNRYRTLLVSDAGGAFSAKGTASSIWHKQAMRAFDIATDQARGLRKRALVSDFISHDRQGAYWGIGTPIQKYKLTNSLDVPASKTKEIAGIRTRLNPFSEKEQCELINWGYAVCDAAVRAHWMTGEIPPTDGVYPNFRLA